MKCHGAHGSQQWKWAGEVKIDVVIQIKFTQKALFSQTDKCTVRS